jgi:hypothetical protein
MRETPQADPVTDDRESIHLATIWAPVRARRFAWKARTRVELRMLANLESRPIVRQVVIGASLLAQLGMGLVYWFVAGMIVPGWGWLIFAAAWLVELVVLAWLARRRPLATPLVPVLALAVLFVAVPLGEQYLGWAP